MLFTCTAAATSRRWTRSTSATSPGWRPRLRARVVLPDYPLAPEHTWRDSFEPLADARRALGRREPRWCWPATPPAAATRSRSPRRCATAAGRSPAELLLISPWVDLTTSTPETKALDAVDPWLFLGKLHAYADWWAGVPEDLGRPRSSPASADLDGLPPALMFCGTRDLLVPGCRLLADRAAASDWDLTYVEAPDLLHVYPAAAAGPRGARAPGTPRGVPPMIRAEAVPFDALDATTAYDVWRLRQDVFVVEQECPYPDLDGRDPEPGTRHVLLREDGTPDRLRPGARRRRRVADRPGGAGPRPAAAAGWPTC